MILFLMSTKKSDRILLNFKKKNFKTPFISEQLFTELVTNQLKLLSNSDLDSYCTSKYIISKEEMSMLKDKPEDLDPDSCCGSGCNMCINDLYNNKKISYDSFLISLRNKLLLNLTV